jgi:hypothetical protein
MYIRHCPSRENAEVHIKRVKKILPEHGHDWNILWQKACWGSSRRATIRNVLEFKKARYITNTKENKSILFLQKRL